MDENNQTSQEILEQLRIQTDAVNSLAGVFAKTMTKEQREQWMLEQNVKRTAAAFDNLGGNLHELSEAEKARIAGEKEAAAATNAMKNAVAASTKGLFNLSSTLSNTSADLTKWGSTIGGVGDVAMGVGKHFGVLGTAIGGAIKGFSIMAPMLLDQTQKMLKAFDSLSEMGGTTNMTTDQVRQLGRASGYTVDNLDKFVNAIKIVGKDINALGINSAAGTKLFGQMTAVGEKNIQAYNRLGISQEQLTEAQATYVKQSSNAGMALAKSPKELQKASLEYVDQLVKLRELTGMSVKESQSALDQAMAQENFNAYLHSKSMERAELLSRAEKESDPIRQKELKARAEQIDQVIASKKELAAWSTANESARDSTALLQSISRDSAPVYTQANAHFLTAGRNIEGVADRLNKGQSALRDYQGEIAKSVTQTNKAFGEAQYAYGEASKSIQQSTGVDNQARKNAARFMDLQTEEGRKRAAAEDKATQEQIERRKKQGEILDESGKPIRDGAKDTENSFLALERALRGLKDDLLGALNPFTKTTFLASAASTALAAAAGYAAFKLGKLGAGGLGDMGDMLKKGPLGRGGPMGGGVPKMPGGLSPDEFKKYEALRKGGMTASEAQRQAGGFKSLVKAEKAITGAKDVAKAAPVAAKAAGGATSAAATGMSTLSKLATPLGTAAKWAPAAGAVISVGTGALHAYEGYDKAEKDLKEGRIDKSEARTKKGEALGEGAGMAAGGAGGAWAGAAAGAAIGSVVPVVGTAIGGIIGAALGGWLGSKGGEAIGKVAGGSIAKMTDDADKKVDASVKKTEAKKAEAKETATDKLKDKKDEIVKVSVTNTTPIPVSVSKGVESLEQLGVQPTAGKKEDILKVSVANTTPVPVAVTKGVEALDRLTTQPTKQETDKKIPEVKSTTSSTGMMTGTMIGSIAGPLGAIIGGIIGSKFDKASKPVEPTAVTGPAKPTEIQPVAAKAERSSMSFTFSEMELAKKDEKLYKEYLARKQELFDKELETRKKNLPKNASTQSQLMEERFARTSADIKAKTEFAERAEKVGAATINRKVEPVQATPAKAPATGTSRESSSATLTGFIPDKKEVESMIREKLLDYPVNMRKDNSLLKDLREEAEMELKAKYAKSQMPKAAIGGVFEGPKSGYPVELHGKEMIVPMGTGTKTNNLAPADEEDDPDLEDERRAIRELKESVEDTDSLFKRMNITGSKLEELQKDKLESEEDAAKKMGTVQDKLKNVFNNAAVDLSNFSNKVKVVTSETGSTGTSGTGIKMPDLGGILGGGAGKGSGEGIKPSSAPPLASMGGGTGITAPPVKQDVKQNLGEVKAALMKRGMTDEKYLNSVLGNVMKESGGKIQNENLDYSHTSNERIRNIFGSRAAGKSDAELNQIKSNPETMGEFMYGKDTKIGRSMGNVEPGDGWKFRGRGYIQLTGKNNYAQASQAVFGDDRLVKDPDLLNDPKVAAEVVAWYMERGKSRMATAMGIDEKNMTQEQANLLATSQIAGGDVRKKGSYIGGELMGKVAAYAGSKEIQGIQPASGSGTMVASADTKKSDIPKAASGGVFDGPESGYLVELHGPETVIPNDKIASIAKKELDNVAKMAGNVTTGSEEPAMPAIDTTSIAKKSVKLFSEEMGPTFAGMNEYTGYNAGPMSTDLSAIQKMASKVGAYDEKTQTITDTDAWKKILHSGIASNYDLGPTTIGTQSFGPEAGDILGDRLKEIMEDGNLNVSDAIQKLSVEFKEALDKMSQDLARSAADTVAPGGETQESPMSEMVDLLSSIADKLSEGNDIQDKILKYSKT